MAEPAAEPSAPAGLVADVVAGLTARGHTVATAESLTGGLLCAALVEPPGASAVVRGAVVAYAAPLKTCLLGVPAEVVAQHGTVSARTAAAMATRVRELLGADWGVATTGVAGPDSIEGYRPGRVHVAVAGPGGVAGVQLDLPGDRATVRAGTVRAAVVLLASELASYADPDPSVGGA